MTLPGALTAAGCRESAGRPLSAISANWVLTLHPAIAQVNEDFRAKSDLVALPTLQGGEPIDDFVREAKDRSSTWDAYIGMTPWVEMKRLARLGVIEPWDAYVTDDMLRGAVPKIRAEATLDGKLYSWPFLVDVVVQAWNGELVEKAGLDPKKAPRTWDELIDNARTVVKAGVAPYGCTFDPQGWRSLAPITHSLASDPYTEDGLFDFMHPATVEALEIMRRMVERAPLDILESNAGRPITRDEAEFAGETVAYSIKYQNAHVRFSKQWTDPQRLQLAALPPNGNHRGTVFWTVGLALLRYGTHKRAAARYAEDLTHDERVWRSSLGADLDAAGQLPAFQSLELSKKPAPAWTAAWVPAVVEAFTTAEAIRPNVLGEQQFSAARKYLLEYLSGSEGSASKALRRAMEAVRKKAARVSV